MCVKLNRLIVETTSVEKNLGTGAFTGVSKHFLIIVPTEMKAAFITEWYSYAGVIYARDEMYGDYVIKENADGTVTVMQYNGYTDNLNLNEITIKGKKISSVAANAFVDENLNYILGD